ncbi:MAG TPA: hypothetical protein VGR37_04660 [Longimicrobiaceae bacterium]|nr:hypothetical protein [Longimicrobiaceae bacterium]
MKKNLAMALLVPLLWACDSTGPDDGRRVAVRFDAITSTGSSASQSSGSGASFDHVPARGPITLTGTNGTLVIQDIRLIVSEIELERAEGSCLTGNDDCEEFEGGPFLVNLLDGTAAEVVSAVIPAGTYTEFEFEVEDLDADDDDEASERQRVEAILAQMRQAYPGFPSRASMVVHGTFTPTGGNAQRFTVYFDAEIEVEHEFATPFRVPEDGAITVNLHPATWFRSGTQVLNLAALNGKTVEFEAEFKSGISVEKD